MRNMEEWFLAHTFHHSAFGNIEELVKLKKEQGLTISVGIPAFNEAETIGEEVKMLRGELVEKYPLIDELAVIDSGSHDQTLKVAKECGADTYLASDYLKELGLYRGKGNNLWKSLLLLKGDIIIWIDADIKNIHPKFIYGLVGPLLKDKKIGYVKAFYERPLMATGTERMRMAGGRVTELLVRPLFNAFYPELAVLQQPLSGEYAGRREILEQLPFFIGYGVETGLLIDIYEKFGLDIIAQVDLDWREHRNRALTTLSRMAFEILIVFLKRAEEYKKIAVQEEINRQMQTIFGRGAHYVTRKYTVRAIERPPMISIPQYRQKRGLENE